MIYVNDLALRERGDLGTQAMLITAWLNLAFPFATLCVLIHHATPGSVQRRAMFPKWFEVIFWLNSFGWFTFVLSQWRAEFGSFVHSVWWLAFFIP